MKPKHSNSTIRAVGQRCLVFGPNKLGSGDGKEAAESKAKSVSFSDYLNRKLHSSGLSHQRHGNNHAQGPNQYEKRGANGVIQESMFKQFNLGNATATATVIDDEVQAPNIHTTFQPRSVFQAAADERSSLRSRLFILGDDVSQRKDANKRPIQLCNEGNVRSNEMQPAKKKRVVVLGDDPKPKRGAHGPSCFSSKQAKPQYNHYKNGAGWWDYEREGVDNDEVGANEVWEGMGSTTLGEIADWH